MLCYFFTKAPSPLPGLEPATFRMLKIANGANGCANDSNACANGLTHVLTVLTGVLMDVLTDELSNG